MLPGPDSWGRNATVPPGAWAPTWSGRLYRLPSCGIQYGLLDCEWLPYSGPDPPVAGLPDAALPAAAACGVSMLAPDGLTPAKMAQQVWSWAAPAADEQGPAVGRVSAKGLPLLDLGFEVGSERFRRRGAASSGGAEEGGCTAVHASDGRWRRAPCSGGSASWPVACRNATASLGQAASAAALWQLGSLRAGGGNLEALWRCPAGFEAAAPVSAKENLLLSGLLKDSGAEAAYLRLPDQLNHLWQQ